MDLRELIQSKLQLLFPSGTFHLLYTLFVCLVLLQLSGCASGRPTKSIADENQKIYTPTQLRSDLAFLDKSLREIHPEPFARLEQQLYQAEYNQLYSELSWPQRRSDFYWQISPLLAKFSDTHMRVLYPEQEYRQFLQRYGSFPLSVLYTSDGLIVVADQQQQPLIPVGAKLLAINDVPVEAMLDTFRRFVPAETISGQQRLIQMEFNQLLWSIYHTTHQYQVDYLWQGEVFQKLVSGVIHKSSPANKASRSHYGTVSINPKTSLLWLSDFNEEYDKFDEFLSGFFQRMARQGKQSLIIDLRYNQGGIIDNLGLLLSYLTDSPIQWASRASLKFSQPFRAQHELLLKNAKNQKYGDYMDWLPMEYFNLLQWDLLLSGDGKLVEKEIKPVLAKQENNFTGNIIVLSNGYCFSACASFIATVKRNNMATIIGEPPGSRTAIQYGYPVEVQLPNTGLKLSIPAMRFVMGDQKQSADQGALPDFSVERRQQHVLTGKDPLLDVALQLLSSD